jgi:hypothetical protein
MIGVWVIWLIIGFIAFRGLDRMTALSRLVKILLAGSWIEFCVALPVDIAIRRRAADCPCATGSRLALVTCIPVLFWVIGPGLFLLYLRELLISRAKPLRTLRILGRRSRRTNEGLKP